MSQGPHCSSRNSRPRTWQNKKSGASYSSYVGVRKRKWGSWVSEIREATAFAPRSHSVILNFHHLIQCLPRPPTSSPYDIKATAAAAATKISLLIGQSFLQSRTLDGILNEVAGDNRTDEHSSIAANFNPTAQFSGSKLFDELTPKQYVGRLRGSAALQMSENEDQLIVDSGSSLMDIDFDLPTSPNSLIDKQLLVTSSLMNIDFDLRNSPNAHIDKQVLISEEEFDKQVLISEEEELLLWDFSV